MYIEISIFIMRKLFLGKAKKKTIKKIFRRDYTELFKPAMNEHEYGFDFAQNDFSFHNFPETRNWNTKYLDNRVFLLSFISHDPGFRFRFIVPILSRTLCIQCAACKIYAMIIKFSLKSFCDLRSIYIERGSFIWPSALTSICSA